jgi:hypothetical protein
MVCLRNISVDTLHEGDTEDNNNNNNNNNNTLTFGFHTKWVISWSAKGISAFQGEIYYFEL